MPVTSSPRYLAGILTAALAACATPSTLPPEPVVVVSAAAHASSEPPPAAPLSAPPLPVPTFASSATPPEDKVVEVSTGSYHACARRASGHVDCWGVLPGRKAALTRPTRIGVGDAAQIASSGQITCILLRSGTVHCFTSALAPGSDPLVPTPIEGIGDAKLVAVGMGGHGSSESNAHTVCALRKDGGVACWTGSPAAPAARAEAIRVAGLPAATSVVVNYFYGSYACALDAAGALRCWTMTEALVEGEYEQHPGRAHPLAAGQPWLVRGLVPLDRVAVSHRRGCGRMRGGKPVCFGGAFEDAPGIRDYIEDRVKTTPEPFFDGAEGFLSATCAWMRDGRVACKNDAEDEDSRRFPGAVAIAMMRRGTHPFYECAALENGGVACRGSNAGGTLGGATTIPLGSPSPVGVVALDRVVDVAAGETDTCALRAGGELLCWGNSGLAPEGRASVPISVAHGVRAIAGGGRSRVYALLADGQVAWIVRPGAKASLQPIEGLTGVREIRFTGRLSARTADHRLLIQGYTAEQVAGLPASLDLVDDNVLGACALEARPGRVLCWEHWRSRGPAPSAPHAIGIDDAVELVDSGRSYYCARRADGSVACWGSHTLDRNDAFLGPLAGEMAASDAPREVPGLRDARALVAGDGAVCAVRAEGRIRCWGRSASEDNDLSMDPFDPATVETALDDVTRVALGQSHACAVRRNGLVACWGRNFGGALGDGSLMASEALVPITGL